MKKFLYKFCSICMILTISCFQSVAYGLDIPANDSGQWNLGNNGYGIAVNAAWNLGLNGSGIRIALIDSGINAAHEDLQGVSIESGYNVIDQNTDTSDSYGHGTVIAGIIAANSHNNVGISGICDGVTIVPIKCFDSSLTNVKNVISGIYMAVDEFHCDVINLSLGVSADTQALRDAVAYAASKNVIIVSAVGNNGDRTPTQLLYPAAYDDVIGVGAHGRDGNICSFSHVNDSVFVTAPGEELYSLDGNDPKGYRTVNGTSFAAAHVSAMAVIAKSYDKNISVAEFKELLRESTVDAGQLGYDTSYGYGMVSVPCMLQALEDLPPYHDIAEHWARENIEFCSELGLLSGTSDGIFSPDMTLTRAMVVSILWRMEGSPASNTHIGFSDVPAAAWFASAVHWVAENGIVSGYGNNTFLPDAPVTREQLASIFYRYAAYQGLDMAASTPAGYTDWSQISAYAVEPFAWSISNGILRGKTDTTVVPQGLATRAEAATILRNYLTIFPGKS